MPVAPKERDEFLRLVGTVNGLTELRIEEVREAIAAEKAYRRRNNKPRKVIVVKLPECPPREPPKPLGPVRMNPDRRNPKPWMWHRDDDDRHWCGWSPGTAARFYHG